MKFHLYLSLIIILILLAPGGIRGQESHSRYLNPNYPATARAHDSVMALKVPLLELPGKYHNRLLPPVVDNSKNEFWPKIQDQFQFYTCQQYAGVAYVFGYEINRLRNQPGWYWENSYPTHYTWNFMNQGERYNGVNFLQSFDVIRQQGEMTSNDYGLDTATSVLGWISGYDKYYRGMSNRLNQVYAIKINSAEGVATLKNYLYDHLEGSPTGGIVCFTTDASVLNTVPVLPPGTPEAGKHIVPELHSNPNHGLAVVGFNDSIRYDLNGDGRYTNNLDINGDGVVDMRDWEIGGFKIANTYGNWWADTGYAYILYKSFASDYNSGGVWNNRVYTVTAQKDFQPLLTLKVKLDYNSRNKIRILAGVNADPRQEMPDHVIDFPIFNFQGGDHVMQGTDAVPEAKTIEFGLDVTPLVNFIPAGTSARYFLMVEERDPDQLGHGTIQQASLVSYQEGTREFPFCTEPVSIIDNNLTLVSVVQALAKPDVHITTTSLPPVVAGQPYDVQLQATGGMTPYQWSLQENYSRLPSTGTMPLITGTSIQSHESYKSWTAVALPFSFPFYGKNYDSIYVNNFGFVTFEPLFLPEPFVTDEMSMLEMFGTITPSFSQKYVYQADKNDGIWFQADATHAVIRWKVSVTGHVNSSVNDFALLLYPDGRFEFRYGTMNNQGFLSTFYTGVSKGDEQNFNLETRWNAADVSGKSFLFLPPSLPAGLSLGREGLLSVTGADTSRIYNIPLQVADAGRITGSKVFMLSAGLEITHQLLCGENNRLEFGQNAALKLVLVNTGLQPIQDLALKITSLDAMLQITDSVFMVPVLNPGMLVTIPAAFSFGLKQVLPDGFLARLNLKAQSGQRMWNMEVRFPIAAPDLVIASPRVDDGVNNIIDPGEVADLIVNVKNVGAVGSRNMQMTLSSPGQGIEILSNPLVVVDQLNTYTSKDLHFQIRASRDVLPGTEVPMQVSLTDSSGVNKTLDFMIRIGTKPVAIVNLSASVNSFHAMTDALNSLHVGYDSIASLPFDYDRYASVFLILGTSSSGSHVLSVSEGASLAAYLQQGGNLYMEGYFTWYYLNSTALHPWFKYTTARIPSYTYHDVTGIQGTFTGTMSYVYTDPLNYAIFSFEPTSPAYATFTNTDNTPKNLEIVYNGSDYKTIGTMLDFSAMIGDLPPSTQSTLMQRYLEFFGLNFSGPYLFFHTGNTSACQGQQVPFFDDSFDNIISRNWEFPGGTPATSEEQNPVVKYNATGNFDVKLTVSDGIHTKTLLKQNYIHVDQCSGTAEHSSTPALFRVYPNPANEEVTIEINMKITGNCFIRLSDLAGSTLMERQQPIPAGNRISLNLTGLGKGLYFIMVSAGEMNSTVKVIRN